MGFLPALVLASLILAGLVGSTFVSVLAYVLLSRMESEQETLRGESAPAFDYLVFAQLWPESECAAASPGTCTPLPPALHNWTIHGLWPSNLHGGEGPEYCHQRPDWHFDNSKVAQIRDRLELRWPNVLHGSSLQSLW